MKAFEVQWSKKSTIVADALPDTDPTATLGNNYANLILITCKQGCRILEKFDIAMLLVFFDDIYCDIKQCRTREVTIPSSLKIREKQQNNNNLPFNQAFKWPFKR